jgi:hypothetical protein
MFCPAKAGNGVSVGVLVGSGVPVLVPVGVIVVVAVAVPTTVGVTVAVGNWPLGGGTCWKMSTSSQATKLGSASVRMITQRIATGGWIVSGRIWPAVVYSCQV